MEQYLYPYNSHIPAYAVATYLHSRHSRSIPGNLARFDGVRYGYRADSKKVREKLKS